MVVVRGAIFVGVVIVVSCTFRDDIDVSSVAPYASMIGTKYCVVSPDVFAYGVYENQGGSKGAPLAFIELIPGPGIGGPEIAFRRHVDEGSCIRIVSAWRKRSLALVDRAHYHVIVDGLNVPNGVVIEVVLARGNEGKGVELNPAIYERVNEDSSGKIGERSSRRSPASGGL